MSPSPVAELHPSLGGPGPGHGAEKPSLTLRVFGTIRHRVVHHCSAETDPGPSASLAPSLATARQSTTVLPLFSSSWPLLRIKHDGDGRCSDVHPLKIMLEFSVNKWWNWKRNEYNQDKKRVERRVAPERNGVGTSTAETRRK